MITMKKRPVGVWFSVALAILLLGLWVGSKLGSKVAYHWYHHQQQQAGTLQSLEREHVESVLSELSAIQTLQLYGRIPYNDKELGKKYLLTEIGGLEALAHRSHLREIRPVIDLDLALAYVDATIAEEQNNNQELATRYMKSAQALFQSLGWRDYSEQTLRIVAKRRLDKWNVQSQTREGRK